MRAGTLEESAATGATIPTAHSPTESHTIQIVGPPEGQVDYYLQASESISKATDVEYPADENDTVTETAAIGYLAPGESGDRDTYEYRGRITQFVYGEGVQAVIRDGEQIPLDEVVEPASGGGGGGGSGGGGGGSGGDLVPDLENTPGTRIALAIGVIAVAAVIGYYGLGAVTGV